MSDKESDWNVPSSDGEEDSAEAVQSQSGKEREIPLNVLRLYSEIEKNGYLELKVKEYRSGVNNVVSEAREQENEEAEELNEATADIKTTEKDETPAVPATDKDKWVYETFMNIKPLRIFWQYFHITVYFVMYTDLR